MAGTFVLEVGDRKFHFNLRPGSHLVILGSETYERRAAAQKGIKSVRKNATDEGPASRRLRKMAAPTS